jgi:hypothetical protein
MPGLRTTFTWLQGDSRDLEEKMSSQVCAIDHLRAFSIPDTLIWRGVMKLPYLQEHDSIGRMDKWLNYLAWSLCWHSLEKKIIKYSISLFLFWFQLLFPIYLNICQLLVVGVFPNLWILKLWFHIEVVSLQFMYNFFLLYYNFFYSKFVYLAFHVQSKFIFSSSVSTSHYNVITYYFTFDEGCNFH